MQDGSALKLKFENFLQSLPRADNRFRDAVRPHTDKSHLAPIGRRRASAYNMWVHSLKPEEAEQSKWPPGACTSSASHPDHEHKPVSTRDDEIKWLGFGSTPEPLNLQPHPGCVWLKSGYSEATAWCEVQLTKQ